MTLEEATDALAKHQPKAIAAVAAANQKQQNDALGKASKNKPSL